MTWHLRALVLLAASFHLFVGFNELLTEEDSLAHKASAWQIILSVAPEWLWAGLFLLVGMLAVVGIIDRRAARFAFLGSGLLFGIWALASGLSWVHGFGATLYGTGQILYLALIQFGVASYVLRVERLLGRVAGLEREIELMGQERGAIVARATEARALIDRDAVAAIATIAAAAALAATQQAKLGEEDQNT